MLGIVDLHCQHQSYDLHTETTSVYIVPEKQITGMWRISKFVENVEQIEKLTVNIAYDN
jgi:hypothetical protein